MTLKLSKIRGKADQYQMVWQLAGKTVLWPLDGENVDLATLADILKTAAPELFSIEDLLPPTVPQYPAFLAPADIPVGPWPVTVNAGQLAADQAALEEEQRLRNMGSALAKGINLGPDDIPVFNGEVGDGLPPVNWGA